ncbi:FecR domain-containing protein [Cylindrospermum sp. FACHB-282]|uniref:FecR domain-containing protein n=1 Tax=Cylindrospermum sp. FACHB-282 TaxID=2692794 RepID=UPI0016873335|nr:FecR domain-containing protein [Cylindrospermum sp. FACHB-282]MBD2388545.1 FecR domain-containing protein [Cylindrospermum sp. FACHB-282]
MFPKFLTLFAIGLSGVMVLPWPNRASAITPLMQAEIQNLRNLVQLIPKNQPQKRPARKLDTLIPGDGLSTGRASLADLRFNDGSLARVGEQALFQFLPKNRDFRLTNGTVLLLIPPGRGQTRIQTPNAAAAIRGSALFVRYNKETDTTIVGALTNSGIEVANKEASQNQVLQAGQLMVVVKGQFQGLYDFDLRTFYETSNLVQGLDLTKKSLESTPDPALASIQAETIAALTAQSPITGQGVVDNPSFLQNRASSANFPSQGVMTENSPVNSINNNSPINSFVEAGELVSDTVKQSVNRINSSNQNSDLGNTNNQNSGSGNSDGEPGGGNTNNQNSGSGNSDGEPGGGNTNNQNSGSGNSDGEPGGGNTNNQNSGPGNSDGEPGGGNTNNQNSGPGNSDGEPGGGNTNNQNSGSGNSDGEPGGGNTNN